MRVLAYGRPLRTHLRLDRARVIVCLDADPLGSHPAAVRYARDFAAGRQPESGKMSRLYVVESGVSLTGAAADHRLAAAAERDSRLRGECLTTDTRWCRCPPDNPRAPEPTARRFCVRSSAICLRRKPRPERRLCGSVAAARGPCGRPSHQRTVGQRRRRADDRLHPDVRSRAAFARRSDSDAGR